jgi:hypothetical protein
VRPEGAHPAEPARQTLVRWNRIPSPGRDPTPRGTWRRDRYIQRLAHLDAPHERRKRPQLGGHPILRHSMQHWRDRHTGLNGWATPRTLHRRPRHTPYDRLYAIEQGDEERGGKHFLVLF